MLLKLLIVEIILRVTSTISPITDVTSLVLLSTMIVKLVVTVKSLLTKTTFRMSFEARLIYRARVVITIFFVFSQFAKREKFVLVGEDLLVSGT